MNKEPQTQTVAVGRVVTAPVGDKIWRGSTVFAGAGKGGTCLDPSQTGDPAMVPLRKLNNADPGPKNV